MPVSREKLNEAFEVAFKAIDDLQEHRKNVEGTRKKFLESPTQKLEDKKPHLEVFSLIYKKGIFFPYFYS